MSPLLIGAIAVGSIATLVALRRRASTAEEPGARKFKTSKKLRFRIGPRTRVERLEDALTAWASLSDQLIEVYGPSGADAYRVAVQEPVRWKRTKGAGGWTLPSFNLLFGLLWEPADAFLPLGARPPFSTRAHRMWNESPDTVIERAEDLVSAAIAFGLVLEQQQPGSLLLGGGGDPTLWDLAEDYARQEAIAALTAMVPGGAAVLAVGQALGGEGWDYGQTTVQFEEFPWDSYRALALERGADLLAFASDNPK